MKIEIPDELFFQMLKTANEREITVVEHIEKMQNIYNEGVRTYSNISQKQFNYFIDILKNKIEVIMRSQLDRANSYLGTDDDKDIIPALAVLFDKATRDPETISEMLEKFYKLEKK